VPAARGMMRLMPGPASAHRRPRRKLVAAAVLVILAAGLLVAVLGDALPVGAQAHADWNPADGAAVQIWDCAGTVNQKWHRA
jgi:hypothetical protein